jgi:hypothetical protein
VGSELQQLSRSQTPQLHNRDKHSSKVDLFRNQQMLLRDPHISTTF